MRFIFIIFALLPLWSKAADESASLNQILQASIPYGGLREEILAEQLKTWPGIKTLDGVAAVYDLWFSRSDGDIIPACRYIQRHFEVPPDKIAGFLLGRAQQNIGEPIDLETYFYFLRDYGDDPRVPKYYASFLDDQRRLKKKVQSPYHDQIGSTARVCDAARLELDRWLEKRGLIKFGDPGNASSALFDAERDQQIREIKPVLMKAGVIELTSTGQGTKTNDAKEREDPSTSLTQAKQPPTPELPTTQVPFHKEASYRWLMWLVIVIVAALGAAWLRRRQTKP